MLVIDRFEPIEIDEHETQTLWLARALGRIDLRQKSRHVLDQGPAVSQSCQWIGQARPLQTAVGHFELSVACGELARAGTHLSLESQAITRLTDERAPVPQPAET